MKDRPARVVRAVTSGSLWLIVLGTILSVSAYSLFVVARHFGVPWFIAIGFSTCLDGLALLAANYSVRYAQEGLSGTLPRTVVRLFALTSAFVQTFHSRLGHELPGSWVLWASLPVGAVLLYEIHIRWERRKALARAGQIHPAPLPSFGIMTWVLFPLTTLTYLREIVEQRRGALVKAALEMGNELAERRSRERARNPENETPRATRTKEVVVPVEEVSRRRAEHRSGNRHAPTRHIREWARRQPERYGTIPVRGPLAPHIIADYQAEEASGP